MLLPLPVRIPCGCLAVVVLLSLSLLAVAPTARDATLTLPVGDGFLRVEACTDTIVRVAFAKDRSFFDRRSLAAGQRACDPTEVRIIEQRETVSLHTGALEVRVDRATGRVGFLDAGGRTIFAEQPNGREMIAADVQGERTFHVRQQWEPHSLEPLYGLGQHQQGLLDIEGYDLDLWQRNTEVAIPFLVSKRSFGLLWDNTSFTRFGDLREPEPIPSAQLFDAEGRPGGLTGRYYAGASFERLVATRVDPRIDFELGDDPRQANPAIHPELPAGDASVRWEGAVVARTRGDHVIHTFSNGGLQVFVDGRLVVDRWRQGWLPGNDVARVRIDDGRRHRLRIDWRRDQGRPTLRLAWKTPAPNWPDVPMSLWSEVGDGIDYYFVYGGAGAEAATEAPAFEGREGAGARRSMPLHADSAAQPRSVTRGTDEAGLSGTPSVPATPLDRVVAGYRRLTGQAPMLPRWAFGLWQSRERYKTAQESLEVLDGFRKRDLPVDVIVQDWQYWQPDQWGSHEFDPVRFPDPDGWIRDIHERHARLVISVWGKFYPGTVNFEALRQVGGLYERPLSDGMRDWLGFAYTFYDPFNPRARTLFWDQLARDLLPRGVDGWWMDATEPDIVQPLPTLEGQRRYMHPTGMGAGARVLNAYSLVSNQGVYEGQRAAAPRQRVTILTRSVFAGQQRYAAATWSGDISSTWTAFRAQIPAGIGFSLSGLPYWTTDSGGFAVPPRFASEHPSPDALDEWRELNVRWFQFATFCPITRLHGQLPYREPWQFGGEQSPAYAAIERFDRLRYRLLPYVYSIAGAVTHEAGTFIRGLAMDFASDPQSLFVDDQYMFGPALLVSPVTSYRARSRRVHLPPTPGGWYDFWAGAHLDGGQTMDADAPYEALPVHVRAGSIVPLGPDLRYTDERPANPITLLVYTGASGRFTLYEDDGVTYEYERGAFTRIPITWDEASRTLTIGRREGAFPGMLAERTFDVVFVSRGAPAGPSGPSPARRSVAYDGRLTTVRMRD